MPVHASVGARDALQKGRDLRCKLQPAIARIFAVINDDFIFVSFQDKSLTPLARTESDGRTAAIES